MERVTVLSGHPQPEKQNQTKKFRGVFEHIMVRQGIHPVSLRAYDSLPYEAPEPDSCKEYDWRYLWDRIFAILQCLKDQKESYKQLKQVAE